MRKLCPALEQTKIIRSRSFSTLSWRLGCCSIVEFVVTYIVPRTGKCSLRHFAAMQMQAHANVVAMDWRRYQLLSWWLARVPLRSATRAWQRQPTWHPVICVILYGDSVRWLPHQHRSCSASRHNFCGNLFVCVCLFCSGWILIFARWCELLNNLTTELFGKFHLTFEWWWWCWSIQLAVGVWTSCAIVG